MQHALRIFYFCNISIGRKLKIYFIEKKNKTNINLVMVKRKVFERKKLAFGIREMHVGNAFISIDLACRLRLQLNLRIHQVHFNPKSSLS